MCGRYPDPFHYEDLNKYFAAVAKYEEETDFTPRFNIAPTQFAPVVREDEGERIITLMRWGLVPHWAKDPTIGNRMINARAETLSEKPAYRKPFRYRQRWVSRTRMSVNSAGSSASAGKPSTGTLHRMGNSERQAGN